MRFRVGLGIVDESGTLVRDTVPTPPVGRIRGRVTGRTVVLAWARVTHAGGLAGYRVERDGRFYALLKRPTVTIPAARARASWSIQAVDRAGNRTTQARIVIR